MEAVSYPGNLFSLVWEVGILCDSPVTGQLAGFSCVFIKPVVAVVFEASAAVALQVLFNHAPPGNWRNLRIEIFLKLLASC